ncbi:unnamed protein product [Protopolystoma xenopodis]|uniref:Uncharacterized protein n=1 Tax=Protopolystoma xenopodis TaxID=117903 RepID=A0A3S5A4X4_9PLAT|nr:unnamed protein product [Protopolystoma xenopodis]
MGCSCQAVTFAYTLMESDAASPLCWGDISLLAWTRQDGARGWFIWALLQLQLKPHTNLHKNVWSLTFIRPVQQIGRLPTFILAIERPTRHKDAINTRIHAHKCTHKHTNIQVETVRCGGVVNFKDHVPFCACGERRQLKTSWMEHVNGGVLEVGRSREPRTEARGPRTEWESSLRRLEDRLYRRDLCMSTVPPFTRPTALHNVPCPRQPRLKPLPLPPPLATTLAHFHHLLDSLIFRLLFASKASL